VLGADQGKAQRGHKGGGDQGVAQPLPSLGQARHDRQHRESRHRRHGGDDANPARIDPDRLEPDREEQQVGANQSEQCAIK
jgi:hypothetical protein